MSYVQNLLTAAKQAQGIPSNYRLARVLGVTDNTLNNWQSGRVMPGDAQAVRLAEMAHEDAGVVLAELARLAKMVESMDTAANGPLYGLARPRQPQPQRSSPSDAGKCRTIHQAIRLAAT